MAERPRDLDPNAPQNPPDAVAHPDVRKKTNRLYLWPLILFFVVFAAALLYRSYDRRTEDAGGNTVASESPTSEGARGTTGAQPTNPDTPGGHETQRTPGSTAEELEHRTGHVVTELGDLLDEKAIADAGRRVHVDDVEVDTVSTPTLFWVRDGNARVQVIAPEGVAKVSPGQQVTIVGTAERSGDVLRIRASSVEPSKQ